MAQSCGPQLQARFGSGGTGPIDLLHGRACPIDCQSRSLSRQAAAMIARLDHLRKKPGVFRHLTGRTVPAFDALAADAVPAVEADHRRALDRPGRERATGAGGAFGLTTADQVLPAVVWLRQYPTQEVLGFLFGVGLPHLGSLYPLQNL